MSFSPPQLAVNAQANTARNCGNLNSKAVAFHPYLIFNGNCQDAMEFYQSCFGGNLSLKLLQDTPCGPAMPAEIKRLVVEGILRSEGITLFASDLGAERTDANGNKVSILFKTSDHFEFMKVYKSLSQQSIHTNEIHGNFTTGEMTNLTDKYGVNWILCFE